MAKKTNTGIYGIKSSQTVTAPGNDLSKMVKDKSAKSYIPGNDLSKIVK